MLPCHPDVVSIYIYRYTSTYTQQRHIRQRSSHIQTRCIGSNWWTGEREKWLPACAPSKRWRSIVYPPSFFIHLQPTSNSPTPIPIGVVRRGYFVFPPSTFFICLSSLCRGHPRSLSVTFYPVKLLLNMMDIVQDQSLSSIRIIFARPVSRRQAIPPSFFFIHIYTYWRSVLFPDILLCESDNQCLVINVTCPADAARTTKKTKRRKRFYLTNCRLWG